MADRQRFKLRNRANSFRFAFAGIGYVLGSQHNAWIHAVVTVAVIVLALWLRTPATDWAILALTITVVWVAEFINTAIEAAVDLATTKDQRAARIAKDVAAGAVLLAALGAIIVGLLILGPPLIARLFG